jgi:hypothetical protein
VLGKLVLATLVAVVFSLVNVLAIAPFVYRESGTAILAWSNLPVSATVVFVLAAIGYNMLALLTETELARMMNSGDRTGGMGKRARSPAKKVDAALWSRPAFADRGQLGNQSNRHRRHVNLRNRRFHRTTRADLAQMFQEYALHAARRRLVVHFHGGLVNEPSGERICERLTVPNLLS